MGTVKSESMKNEETPNGWDFLAVVWFILFVLALGAREWEIAADLVIMTAISGVYSELYRIKNKL